MLGDPGRFSLVVLGIGTAFQTHSRIAAEVAIGQIDDDLLRFAAGIWLGLLIGLVVGGLMTQTWGTACKNTFIGCISLRNIDRQGKP
jgi:hypothetical protein